MPTLHELAKINGVLLTALVDDADRVVEMTLDPSQATGPARLRYPADGSKVDVTVGPGDLPIVRTFVGNNRLSRLLTIRNRPVDGLQVLSWTSPSWSLESV